MILTDHGNGMRDPEPPAYRSGVLCLDGVEISTDAGHFVALGLPRAPYPIAGHAARRHRRRAPARRLRLRRAPGLAEAGAALGRLGRADFDGLEWLNADSEWRDEFWGSLGRVLLTYPFRPTETLAALLDRPTRRPAAMGSCSR